ncbi:hypothetical protein BJ684DRAFT_16390 [Piptocephalis cylindrospora]|uniref:Uncharacterized protein n=1 Tax=Piptocephalis cylindrospora TaxID=1907219 RepID=A0A4P9Y316_9FUNG|nr:hypothetical protein BJ684DRAFT_16390 [Piptocephalis cylindrospora]|eukprot:RKP13183.1 hypothetical protein BJ684DRAFT_16390 [Piptocephalis cylindrospora]
MRLLSLPIILTLLALPSTPVQAAPMPAWSVGKIATVGSAVAMGTGIGIFGYHSYRDLKKNEKVRKDIEALQKEKNAVAEANALASFSPKKKPSPTQTSTETTIEPTSTQNSTETTKDPHPSSSADPSSADSSSAPSAVPSSIPSTSPSSTPQQDRKNDTKDLLNSSSANTAPKGREEEKGQTPYSSTPEDQPSVEPTPSSKVSKV